MSSKLTLGAVTQSLSQARISTYQAAIGAASPDDARVLDLYAWNARVSGVLLPPLHICEVVIRNAVSEVLEKVYGAQWPWSPGFEQSLPAPTYGYSPRKDLQSARYKMHSTGKVIPEFKFVFWQKMFTSRYDKRLWTPHLRTILPHADPNDSVANIRQRVYDDLEVLRALRNRIAHHEPLLKRNLTDDYQKVRELVGLRCALTVAWMEQENQSVLQIIAAKP